MNKPKFTLDEMRERWPQIVQNLTDAVTGDQRPVTEGGKEYLFRSYGGHEIRAYFSSTDDAVSTGRVLLAALGTSRIKVTFGEKEIILTK